MLDLTEYSKFFISLFAIVDPLSAIPIFITLTRQQTKAQQLKTARLTAVEGYFHD
ncbi:MarC family protein [Teredinibacter sp. KSP-S5-2]|uniref:MarC family protein n=1 Tax=Teredinibacter sp. KSP-S5-2 TaxID=3034506 RepID=UPI002934B563|nr:MarC family protein [Teredinibacter sp. KSP-S5-2]WNO08311.1 MarC family protein [Teredinibacter sp. KSP-S5-2]